MKKDKKKLEKDLMAGINLFKATFVISLIYFVSVIVGYYLTFDGIILMIMVNKAIFELLAYLSIILLIIMQGLKRKIEG